MILGPAEESEPSGRQTVSDRITAAGVELERDGQARRDQPRGEIDYGQHPRMALLAQERLFHGVGIDAGAVLRLG